MSLRCHLCSHRFEAPSGEAFVRCPKCQAKLKNKSGDKKKKESPSRPVGCPGCLKCFQSSDAFPIACRYCGTKIDQENGEGLVELLKDLEARSVEKLLRGEPGKVIVDELEAEGVGRDAAYKYLHRLLNELPFNRYKHWKDGSSVKPPHECDNCGVTQELKPYEAHWALDQEQLRYRPDFGGFTGEFGKLENYDKFALYYLCGQCKKAKPDKLGSGYPASAGYILKKRLASPKGL